MTIRGMIGQSARNIGVVDALEPTHSARRLRDWQRASRPIPAPAAAKRAMLRAYGEAYGLRVLVETGTYRADTVRGLRDDFDLIHSVEIDDALYAAAVGRCKGQANARIYHGDSAGIVTHILEELTGPALFWLDAHYSGEGTGGHHQHPTAEEVRRITERKAGHVVLIDDVRLFGEDDYPPISVIEEIAAGYGYRFEVRDDVARMAPGPSL